MSCYLHTHSHTHTHTHSDRRGPTPDHYFTDRYIRRSVTHTHTHTKHDNIEFSTLYTAEAQMCMPNCCCVYYQQLILTIFHLRELKRCETAVCCHDLLRPSLLYAWPLCAE